MLTSQPTWKSVKLSRAGTAVRSVREPEELPPPLSDSFSILTVGMGVGVDMWGDPLQLSDFLDPELFSDDEEVDPSMNGRLQSDSMLFCSFRVLSTVPATHDDVTTGSDGCAKGSSLPRSSAEWEWGSEDDVGHDERSLADSTLLSGGECSGFASAPSHPSYSPKVFVPVRGGAERGGSGLSKPGSAGGGFG